jgi:DNA-binding CsgD family transcriptional regulator
VALAVPALTHGIRMGAEDAFAVLHGLYWLTADIAQRAPLLLAIDDLHWADPPSQRFAAYLVRRLEGLPVLLVVTVREPRAATAQEKALIAGLSAEPCVTTIHPGPLSAVACSRLVGAALGDDASPAFGDACLELTGGNPLLLHGLLSDLAAEGLTGKAAEVPHVRRRTPGAVSRNVLVRLGRMPAAVLTAARAVAVLGTAATAERAGRLAGIDGAASAEAISMLMEEGILEGEWTLRFVHPLIRSAVYQDLAPPVRQRWHKEAALMLDAEDAEASEVTVHLLAAETAGDAWVVDRLRRAASDARGRGAPEVATQCLERALAEPPAADVRADVLFELGTAELLHTPAMAIAHLTEALTRRSGGPQHGEIALALSEALQLSGRFAEAIEILRAALRQAAPGSAIATSLQAALLNLARWDLDARAITWRILQRLEAEADGGAGLDPQVHANLAIELAGAGTNRERAARHAREATRAISRLITLTSTAMPEAVCALLWSDHSGEAWAVSQEYLRLAQERGRPLVSAIAAAATAVVAYHDGDVQQALAYAQQAMTTGGDNWISVIAVAFTVHALIDRGAIAQARTVLTEHGMTGDLIPLQPYNVVRHARGCLHAAAGDHRSAVADLRTAGALAIRWGVRNPAMLAWRSNAALSLAALGDRQTATRLAGEEVDLARGWGDRRGLGVALRAAGLVARGNDGIALLAEAVSVLRPSLARLELARALLDLGVARRRAGARDAARDLLRESLDLARALGGLAIAQRAREELVAADGRPRRDAIRGADALTPSELRVAQLAAMGQTNRHIAQALFVTQRTVESHLTSAYAKLGIDARPQLAAALAVASSST